MILTKVELLRQVKKLMLDKQKPVSNIRFAELCGVSVRNMYKIFVTEDLPLTEMVQIRVNRGYDAYKKGLVRVMQRRDQTHFVDYRKEPKPSFAPSMGLKIENGQISLRVGMVSRYDYSQRDLNGD